MGRKSNAEKAANEAAEMQQEVGNETNQDMGVSEVEQVAEVVEVTPDGQCKTVQVVANKSAENPNGFIVINAEDFDASKHQVFK